VNKTVEEVLRDIRWNLALVSERADSFSVAAGTGEPTLSADGFAAVAELCATAAGDVRV